MPLHTAKIPLTTTFQSLAQVVRRFIWPVLPGEVIRFIRPLLIAPRCLPLTLVLSVTFTACAEGATYYVATDGVDAPGCGSQSNPCRHMYYAARLMASGDTMAILPGTYVDHLYSDNGVDPFNNYGPGLPSGTAGNPTTIKAANGPGTVVLKLDESKRDLSAVFQVDSMSYVVIDGLIFEGEEGGLNLGDADGRGPRSSYITVKNSVLRGKWVAMSAAADYLEMINNKMYDNGRDEEVAQTTCCPWPAYAFYGCGDHQLWQGNEFYESGGYALHFNKAGARCLTNSVIVNNIFHDNSIGFTSNPYRGNGGQGAIILNAGENVLIYNNLFYNNNGPCIMFASGRSGNKFYNNTCYDDIAGGGYILQGVYSSNNDIQNNIAWSFTNDNSDNPATVSNNLWTESTNPQFVNASAFDFHLQSGSPARDRGMTLPDVPCDFDGNQRPAGGAYDIGAYEYGASPGGACAGGGPPPLRGDLNGDGKRDLADVRLLIYMLLGQEPTTPAAELTGDGAVRLADVQALIKLIVGLP